jgi:hypothetical protein
MSKRWTESDLGGGGLQSANIRLAALLRKRSTAYALLVLFPLGIHRDYLHDTRGAWLYRGGTGLAIAAYLLGETMLSAGVLAVLAAGAIYDMVRIEHMTARVNKRLRIKVYLRQASGAPADFKGRFTEEQDHDPQDEQQTGFRQTPPGPSRPRVPSFAEQEQLLRELASARAGKQIYPPKKQ